MTRKEFIENNAIIQKAIKWLDKNDIEFLSLIAEKKIDPHDDHSILRFKQVVYHMAWNLNFWEQIRLRNAFKTMMTLEW